MNSNTTMPALPVSTPGVSSFSAAFASAYTQTFTPSAPPAQVSAPAVETSTPPAAANAPMQKKNEQVAAGIEAGSEISAPPAYPRIAQSGVRASAAGVHKAAARQTNPQEVVVALGPDIKRAAVLPSPQPIVTPAIPSGNIAPFTRPQTFEEVPGVRTEAQSVDAAHSLPIGSQAQNIPPAQQVSNVESSAAAMTEITSASERTPVVSRSLAPAFNNVPAESVGEMAAGEGALAGAGDLAQHIPAEAPRPTANVALQSATQSRQASVPQSFPAMAQPGVAAGRRGLHQIPAMAPAEDGTVARVDCGDSEMPLDIAPARRNTFEQPAAQAQPGAALPPAEPAQSQNPGFISLSSTSGAGPGDQQGIPAVLSIVGEVTVPATVAASSPKGAASATAEGSPAGSQQPPPTKMSDSESNGASAVETPEKAAPAATQPAHRPDSDTAQPNTPPVSSFDSAGVPAIAAAHASSHQTAGASTAGPAANAVDAAVVNGAQAQRAAVSEPVATSPINASQLIQNLSSASMHVGMRSAEFGDISIRTQVSQQQMLTQISVDHGDLGKAISEHLPAVQTKLADNFGLRASIEVHSSGMSFSGERGYASQQDRRPQTTRGAPVIEPLTAEVERVMNRSSAIPDDNNRLDIRA